MTTAFFLISTHRTVAQSGSNPEQQYLAPDLGVTVEPSSLLLVLAG